MQETEIIQRLGAPMATGGGGMSKVLKRPIPRWLRYSVAPDAMLQLQLDERGTIQMATIAAPDMRAA